MAGPNSPDELNIGMGLDGEEDVASGIERIERIIRQAAKNISQAFDENATVTKVFNQNLLALEKTVVAVTRQYAALGKAGEQGFEEITSRQTAALEDLTKIQEKLRQIDIEASKPGVAKSRLAELKKQSKELTNDLQLMVRELLSLQQLDIVLKAKILPKVEETPIKLTSIDDAVAQFNRLDKIILGFQDKFRKITKLEGEGQIFTDLIAESEIELKVLKDIEEELGRLRKSAEKADGEGLTKLVEDSKVLQNILQDIDRSFIDIKRRQMSLPEVAKATLERPYTGDIDLERALRNQNKSAFGLEKQLNDIARQTYGGSESFTKEAKAAQQEIKALTERILQLQRVSKKTDDKDIIEQLNLESKATQRQLNAVEDHLLRIKRIQLQSPAPGKSGEGYGIKGALGGIADVLNIPGVGAGLGAAAGIAAITYGLHQFVDYSKLAIDKASDQIRAHRLLESSAIEAGIGIDKLADRNKKFAELVGLGDVAASSTIAKIAQLTVRSQRPEDIDKLIKGFADIGAARGLNPTELETIVQQIITGQDEGYKKLGLANPSQIYSDYARKNNRSPESLSSVERAQIFQNEFLKKADIFNGAAEARINSLDGAVAKLYASFDNLGYSLAKAVAGSPDAAVLIDDITSAVKRLTGSLDELGQKQSLGTLTDADITAAAQPGILSQLRKLLGLGALIGGKGLSILGYFNSQAYSAGEAITNYGAGELAENNQQLNEDVIRRRLNAQKLQNFNNDKIAADRRIELAREIAEEDKRQLQQKEIKRYEDLFKKRRDVPADLEKAIQEIQNYQKPEPKKLDEQELERRVQDQYKNLKPEEIVRLGQLGVVGEAALKDRFRKQIKAEMEAALEVSNGPLFDEATKEKLIEKAQQDLSNAVQKAYKRVLDDKHLRIETLLQTLGQIKGDKRLFPEVQEALEREAKAIQERMQKLSEELLTSTKSILIDREASLTGNPLVKQLNDVADAFENTRKKFAPWGKEFAETMAKLAENTALRNLEKTLFQISDQGLKYRQEARRLEQASPTQTDAFQRRLEQVEKSVDFAVSDSRLSRQAGEDVYYANAYNPYNPKSFLLDKLGYTGYDKLTDGFQGSARNRGENPVEYQKRINQEREKYLNTSIKIKDAVEDLGRLGQVDLVGTGLYGQEAIAKARLDRLPSRDELLPRLSSYGQTKEEALQLLRQRAEAQVVLRDANVQRFKDYIANQRFVEYNRKDVDERLLNLQKFGLNTKDKLEQYLNITNELGTAELTPGQRQGRIQVLNQLAQINEQSRKDAEERLKFIGKTMETIGTQLQQKGLRVDLGEQTITEVNVSSDLSSEKRTRRASQNDTKQEY